MSERNTKTKHVKEYLMQGNVLTGRLAVDLFHLYRLPVVIDNLRKMGLEIETKMIYDKDCFGNPSRYAEYRYVGEENGAE